MIRVSLLLAAILGIGIVIGRLSAPSPTAPQAAAPELDMVGENTGDMLVDLYALNAEQERRVRETIDRMITAMAIHENLPSAERARGRHETWRRFLPEFRAEIPEAHANDFELRIKRMDRRWKRIIHRREREAAGNDN